MLNEYNERKQTEWRKEGLTPESMDTEIYLRIIKTGNKFISDLIDEMESNAFLKDIVTKTRIDTLRQVLPEEVMIDDFNGGFNYCRKKIIDKAKELWGLELNNLNK